MCILSELENANVLGHLITHGNEILHSLTSDQGTAGHFCHLMHHFEGTITQSAIDAALNHWRASQYDNIAYITRESYHTGEVRLLGSD